MYTITELAAEFNISPHTIHAWRKKGVLPPPTGGRKFARYTDEHVRIIRAIRATVHDRRVTLSDLAERLNPTSDE